MQHLKPYSVDDNMTTTSVKLAEHYERRHDNVLQQIDTYISNLGGEAAEFVALSFQETFQVVEMPNGAKRSDRMYVLNEEAALIIAGRMHGKRAALRQIMVAKAFTAMKRTIKHQQLQIDTANRKLLADAREQIKAIEDAENSKANTLAKLFNISPSKTRSLFQQLEVLGLVTSKEKTIHGFAYSPTSAGMQFVDHIDYKNTIHWKPEITSVLTGAQNAE